MKLIFYTALFITSLNVSFWSGTLYGQRLYQWTVESINKDLQTYKIRQIHLQATNNKLGKLLHDTELRCEKGSI